MKRRLQVLSIAIAVVLADQASKAWAEQYLTLGVPKPLIGDFLRLHLTFNSGAAFSFLTGSTWVFSLVSTSISILIISYSARFESTPWALMMGGVLGGGVGNLIDRMTNPPNFGFGHVTDFLELPYWPIFNLADSAVVVSAIGLVLLSSRGYDMLGRKK